MWVALTAPINKLLLWATAGAHRSPPLEVRCGVALIHTALGGFLAQGSGLGHVQGCVGVGSWDAEDSAKGAGFTWFFPSYLERTKPALQGVLVELLKRGCRV